MSGTPRARWAGRGAGAAAICLAATLWGFDGVVLTPRLFALPVPFVVFLLHAVPFLLMQPFLAAGYRRLGRLAPGEWATLALVSLVGGAAGTLAIVKALFLVDFNQLSVVVLLQKLQPIFAIGLAVVLLGEPLTRRFLASAATAVGGGYLLTFGFSAPDLDTGEATARAALWAVVAAASFGAATVLGKKILGAIDFWQATLGRYGITTAALALWLAASGAGFPFGEVTERHWLFVLVIGLTTGSGAIFLYYWGLQRVRATTSTICELCLPLAAIGFDLAVNRSLLTWPQLFGGLLMIAAITRVSVRQARSGAA